MRSPCRATPNISLCPKGDYIAGSFWLKGAVEQSETEGSHHISQLLANQQSSLQSIRRPTHSAATTPPAFPTDQIDQ